jgi:hypothetical protein
MGCWIELQDPKLGKGLRFKVDDGVIVFPVSAKGKRASAEGTFQRIDLAQASQHETADLEADPKAATTALASLPPGVGIGIPIGFSSGSCPTECATAMV